MSDTRSTRFASRAAETSAQLPAVHGSGEAPAAVAAQIDDGRAEYSVTHLAGPRLAGQRVKVGDTLRLTEPEARSDLLAGALVKKGEELPQPIRKATTAASDGPAPDAAG